MKTALLDGRKIFSPAMLHESLKKQLDFPDWYGMNLDALHDMLTGPESFGIVITNTELLRESLAGRWEAFAALMEDCERENPRLRVLWEPFRS